LAASEEKKMSLPGNYRLVGFIFLVSLTLFAMLLILSGCAGSPATTLPPSNPTVIIVQYITQVVATVTPAPPLPATSAPTSKPVASGGFDPYSVKPYYPIRDCAMASRLHVGDVAFVASGADSTNLHVSRNVGFAPVVRRLTPGELLYVTEDPTCNRNGLVWGVVADADFAKGFVLEGNGETYWILPFGETFDQAKLKDLKKATP
jgi:hypothetical protein